MTGAGPSPDYYASILNAVFQTTTDTILTVDRKGMVLAINRTMPPQTMAEVIGSNCFDWVPPESRARVAQAIEHVFTTRQIDEYEIQGPHGPDGLRVWSYVRVGPVIEHGEVTAVLMCASNISTRLTAERERKELLERLQKISSQLPGVVYQFKLRPDGSFAFPYASEGIRQVFRVTPEEVVADAAKVMALAHPEDNPRILESIRISATTLQPWQLEFRIKFPDQTVRWLYGNSVPQREPDGSVIWHGFITDITERKEAAEAAAALEAQLRQAQRVESIGRLAGGVAHDFNNLLSAILGFSELARKYLPAESEPAHCIARVIEAANRGGDLTQQMLAFARKKIVKPEVLNLNRVIARMEPLLRRLIGEDLDFVLVPGSSLGLVSVDMGSMEQVIMNLAVNARDAMPTGGKLTIETQNVTLNEKYAATHAEMQPGPYVLLAVTDTGTGIPADIIGKIFEPFFTTKSPGQGTGLGLAMCHGIVKQAGGQIEVYSEPGKGSAFKIYLPVVMEGSEGTRKPRLSAPMKGGTETILFVEDEPLVRDFARQALTGLGYKVIDAANGKQALERIASHLGPLDLLITDVVMPKMGGTELSKKLVENFPNVKVLYSSGYTENAIVHHGILGANINFLQKPYTPSALAETIRKILDAEETPPK